LNHQTLALLAFSALGALAGSTPAVAADDATATLHRLFDSEWERSLREDPTSATYLGDHRYDALWPDMSPAANERSHQGDQAVLAQLASIRPEQLSDADQLNRELFRRMYQGRVDGYEYGTRFTPVSQKGSIATAAELAELIDFKGVREYEDWISRINGLGVAVDQTIAFMQEGVKRKQVQPRIIMERVPKQIDAQIVTDAATSPFYAPFRSMPDSIPAGEQARLRAAASKAIAETAVPAFKRLRAYVEKDYLPKCRDTVGIWDTPGGDAWYQKRIAWFTTTNLTADQIHEIGLQEVARIRGEMEMIIRQVGFQGDFPQFLQYLRTDPKFRYTDPQQLLQAYMVMAKRIDPLLPQYFGRLPRMPYGVRPIPEQSAPDTTTAYYQPGSQDGTRAGYYYVNLYKPEERPKYEIPVLTIHEAVPGHHLQIALAQELGDLPKFRRDFEATAFVEGWALYSESLGEEMGLYKDPYDKFGQLTYDMWRAVRLVVDTGMHAKHWTRQQAIDYFKANAAKTELDIVNEVDRYIAWPGQALAYKVGQMRIQALRREATAKLGPKFDLRAFHDVVLGSGAVPLDVMEANVRRWMVEAAK
jgi:uncharacterized protein (DUF885 family)